MLRLASLIQMGKAMNPQLVNAQTVIRMGTVNGAKALGFNDTGIIKEGYKADLLLIDIDQPHFYPKNNPASMVIYSAQSSDVHTVIVNGDILMENRVLTKIDAEKVKYEVESLSKRLLGR